MGALDDSRKQRLGPYEEVAIVRLRNRPPLNSSELFHVLKLLKEQTRHRIEEDYTFIEFEYKDLKRLYRLFFFSDGSIELATTLNNEVSSSAHISPVMAYLEDKINQAIGAALKPQANSKLPTYEMETTELLFHFLENWPERLFPDHYTIGVRVERDYSFLEHDINPLTGEKNIPKSWQAEMMERLRQSGDPKYWKKC